MTVPSLDNPNKAFTLPARRKGTLNKSPILSSTSLQTPQEILQKDSKAVHAYKYSKKVGSYLLGECLGKGSFARVNEGLHIPTGEKVAVKVIEKSRCATDAYVRRTLRREGRLLQQLKHPNLIQLLEILETEHAYYLALELCPGEGLLGRIGRKGRLSEAVARRYLTELMAAVAYMHRQGVMHRDLKVENILLSEDDHVKVIDFGLSTQVRPPGTFPTDEACTDRTGRSNDASTARQGELDGAKGLCKTQCGSPAYAAPEVLSRKPYGMQADVWSIGVNLFAMVAGMLPFSVRPFSIPALCQKMLSREMNSLPTGLSSACVDLITRLLDPNPETRLRLHEAQQHAWLRGGGPETRKLSFVWNAADESLYNSDEDDQDASCGSASMDDRKRASEAQAEHERKIDLVQLLLEHVYNCVPNVASRNAQSNARQSPAMKTMPSSSRVLSKQSGAQRDEHLREYIKQILSNTPGPINASYHLLVSKARRYCRVEGLDLIGWLRNHQTLERGGIGGSGGSLLSTQAGLATASAATDGSGVKETNLRAKYATMHNAAADQRQESDASTWSNTHTVAIKPVLDQNANYVKQQQYQPFVSARNPPKLNLSRITSPVPSNRSQSPMRSCMRHDSSAEDERGRANSGSSSTMAYSGNARSPLSARFVLNYSGPLLSSRTPKPGLSPGASSTATRYSARSNPRDNFPALTEEYLRLPVKCNAYTSRMRVNMNLSRGKDRPDKSELTASHQHQHHQDRFNTMPAAPSSGSTSQRCDSPGSQESAYFVKKCYAGTLTPRRLITTTATTTTTSRPWRTPESGHANNFLKPAASRAVSTNENVPPSNTVTGINGLLRKWRSIEKNAGMPVAHTPRISTTECSDQQRPEAERAWNVNKRSSLVQPRTPTRPTFSVFPSTTSLNKPSGYYAHAKTTSCDSQNTTPRTRLYSHFANPSSLAHGRKT